MITKKEKKMKRQLQEAQDEYRNIQTAICGLLQWDDETYCQHVYDTGCAYLRQLPGIDENMAFEMEGKKAFWSWFRLYRHELDMAIISQEAISTVSLRTRIEIYNRLHAPQALAIEARPNKTVMSECFKNYKYA